MIIYAKNKILTYRTSTQLNIILISHIKKYEISFIYNIDCFFIFIRIQLIYKVILLKVYR